MLISVTVSRLNFFESIFRHFGHKFECSFFVFFFKRTWHPEMLRKMVILKILENFVDNFAAELNFSKAVHLQQYYISPSMFLWVIFWSCRLPLRQAFLWYICTFWVINKLIIQLTSVCVYISERLCFLII